MPRGSQPARNQSREPSSDRRLTLSARETEWLREDTVESEVWARDGWAWPQPPLSADCRYLHAGPRPWRQGQPEFCGSESGGGQSGPVSSPASPGGRDLQSPVQPCCPLYYLLSWPKSSFRFFRTMLWEIHMDFLANSTLPLASDT